MAESDAFIVTKNDDNWRLVESSVLDKYSIKTQDGSKQIEGEGFDYNLLLAPLYDPEGLLELLEVNTYHAQCTDIVARDAAGLNWTINSTTDKQGSPETKKRVEQFIRKISPNINDLLYKRNYDKRAVGYGAVEIIREGKSKSPINGLDHIPSQHLRIHRDGFRVQQQVGAEIVWFVIYGKNKMDGKLVDVHYKTGEIYPYNSLKREERANELLWTVQYTPKSQYYGLPKITPAISAVHGDVSQGEYNTSFFKNYGMPAFAVTVTGDFQDYKLKPGDEGYDETKTLRYKISQQLKEVIKNPHSAVTILVPSEGDEGNVKVELKPLSILAKEASFRLYRKDNRDEVIVAHGVPPYRIGIAETGSLGGSIAEEATKIYKTSIIEPLQQGDESDINLLLNEMFPASGWQFALTEIDIRDMLSDLKIAESLVKMASMKPIQVIRYFGERFGLEEDDNPYLDEYYLNGVPLDKVWAESRNIDPPGASTVLDNLEEDLSEGLDDIDEEDGTEESRAVKNAFDRLRNRISTAISR
jgi:PBSX family phage portal protein